MTNRNNFLFVDLAQSIEDADAEPKPFDGMSTGKFTDMWGREIEFKAEEMPTYAVNTTYALESTKDSAGEVVGFPIDAMNHENREAAGWIVAVALDESGTKLRFTPRWNALGRELISGDYARFFSPTIDMKSKTVVGGSLTNWPATRTEANQILLKPVELSATMSTFEAQGPNQLVVSNGGGKPADPKQGVLTMELTEQELSDRITSAVTAALAAQKPAAQNIGDLSALLDMEGLTEEARKQRKSELAAYIAAERQRAENEWRAEMARFAHESKMAELSNRLVGGTEAAPRGLRVSAEELKAHLMKLDPDEAKFWGDLMTKTQSDGLMDFGEMGHGRVLQGTRTLDPKMAVELRKWLDGDKGHTVDEFFRVNSDILGNQSDYNLTEFAGR